MKNICRKICKGLLLFCMGSQFANAFNFSKCEPIIRGGNGIGALGSSTSYISSTSECSAIGMNREDQAKLLYVFNEDKVLEDIAKGDGEYYRAMSKLWGCKQDLVKSDIQGIRKSYHKLLRVNNEARYYLIKQSSSCSKS